MSELPPLKILWVKTGPLFPLDTGGKKRSHAMLRELNRRHSVTYLSVYNRESPPHASEENADYADEKIWTGWDEARKGGAKFYFELAANFCFSSFPYALSKYRSSEFENRIGEFVNGGEFDIVICDFLSPALNFRKFLGQSSLPIVLFQHNMEAQIWQRMAGGAGNAISRFYLRSQAARMARWEARLSGEFDGVITVSPEDSKIARDQYGLRNVLGDVPTGVDFDYFGKVNDGELDEGFTLGFLGSMDWMPNIEGVHWFVRDIWPLVQDQVPESRLLVIGRSPPDSVKKLSNSDSRIEVTGTVDDVRPFLSRCHALAVPLLSGGGTRIKIMEALAAGLPVVSTKVGAEGLGLVDGEQILIADEASDFADQIRRVAEDGRLRQQLATSGAEKVRDGHSWEVVTQGFEAHLRTAIKRFHGRDREPGSS